MADKWWRKRAIDALTEQYKAKWEKSLMMSEDQRKEEIQKLEKRLQSLGES